LRGLPNYVCTLPGLQLSTLFNADGRIRKVRLVDNVVAVKDASRFVTRDSHGNYFGTPRLTMFLTAERRKS
jgi:hypothetical protein